ncbi:hypothetical protein ACTZWX_03985 [Marinobacter sp. NSM]
MSQAPHNHAMHRMPNPPLRSSFATGDGGRYVVGSFSVAQRDMFPKTYPAVWNDLKVAGRL